ncbi:hypothetical protein NE237_012659 [Protea cynaroides]|uniref:GTD-binding domain-containing protein n=1 Tax=Protea cynaroides TaxID=273540 RepID=A0A9Q0JXT8_9MAGN|nr:hypothetical protein NE237_012659 [Protea cynaroides]
MKLGENDLFPFDDQLLNSFFSWCGSSDEQEYWYLFSSGKLSSSLTQLGRCSRGFRTVLASAVLEWLLIFLLFVDAIFSYLVTKFSRYCELQIPCLLCSRLDHVLGDENPGFYRNLICGAHKLEISSLVLCHIHDKLADVHGVCEACLFSFATENKSNTETYRLLVGKLGLDPECCVDEDPLLNDPTPDSSRTRTCSCCNNSWAMRSSVRRFPQTKLIAPEVGELDVLSPGPAANSDFQYQGGMQKIREKPSGLLRASHQSSRSVDPLSHIGYTELKITSDTESEVPFSDDDDASTLACEPDDLKEDLISQHVQLDNHQISPEIFPQKMSDDLILEYMIHEASTSEHTVLVPPMQLEVDKPHDVTYSTSDIAIGHGLEELNWHQVEQRVNPSAPCELISLDDVPASTSAMEAPVEVLGDNLDAMGASDTGHTSIMESGFTTTVGLDLKPCQVSNDPSPPLPNSLSDAYKLVVANMGSQASGQFAEQLSGKHSARVSEGLKLLPSQIYAVRGLEVAVNVTSPKVHGDGDDLKTSDSSSSIRVQILQKKISLERNGSGFESLDGSIVSESGDVCRPGSGLTTTVDLDLKKCQVSNDSSPRLPNSLSDAYKLVVGNMGSQASGQLAEQLSGKQSARVSEDLKLLLSQISAVRGLELSVNDTSPKVHGDSDDLKTSDSSSSIGVQILQKKISLERNESGFESLDGSIVSEIEGENVIDRLKRQVEYDRKSLSALYKELEEERNAAAVAANQALAMITRLQEEKATLNMEALQYLRMMEEQAEYDVEALQKANDLLSEREKEIQDLEAELECYREKFRDESMLEKVQEATSDLREVDMRMELSEPNGIETDANIPYYSPNTGESESSDKPEGTNDMNVLKNSVLDIEDERLYISQCLKKLEKRLHLFSNNWVYVDLSNGVSSGKDEHEVDDLEEIHQNELAQGASDLVDDDFLVQKGALLPKGNSPAEERHNPPVLDPLSDDEEKHHIDCDRPGSAMDGGVYDFDSIGNEVSELNERLLTLEADRNFLEHAINSLRNGDEGLKFIQEIAQHLCELRKIGIRRRKLAVA